MTSPIPLPSPESGPTSPLRHILTEMTQGFRGPAVLLDPQGQALHTNATSPGDDAATRPQEWPHRIAFAAGADEVYYLAVACSTNTDSESVMQLPPRLARIAKLVVAGLTDKQIASRTGLSFSTVRTYVRQIYRRTNVHSRVGLVRMSSGGFSTERMADASLRTR